ncbi:L,D-transpeptidase [Sphingomonas sp. M1-B02]|uniref:L,D-transpeptidase n=1 Tax=Sphingomonas sp. M1-B02 TaxID=3114300 RepID=UPI00223FD190|nr:L,D-transpeptidase [Sphingomonas sp. S6-11]UZK65887.1 L,D-transpeptidase [Sphingomonas sp. S6-11]
MSLLLALLAAGFAPPSVARGSQVAAAEQSRIDFKGQAASSEAREVAHWALGSGDSRGLPFMIIDKRAAKVFLFDKEGRLLGAAPALLGLGNGDDSVPGIGQRRLATITPVERTTPAGRFQASLGHDFEQDILWIDYASALSLHRVISGNPKDRRRARLASATAADNRISFGCINVPAAFYDDVVVPAFTATVGIVYILPETKPIDAVFSGISRNSSR